MRERRASFTSFYLESKDVVYRTVLLATRDPSRAEDAVQEAFARAFAAWERIRSHPNPIGWVARVAMNESVSVWRRLRRESPDSPDLPAPPEEEPLDTALVRLVWRLPRRQRHVLALRFLLDQTTEETARALGIAPGTVTAHLHRALTSLRERLEEEEKEVAP